MSLSFLATRILNYRPVVLTIMYPQGLEDSIGEGDLQTVYSKLQSLRRDVRTYGSTSKRFI